MLIGSVSQNVGLIFIVLLYVAKYATPFQITSWSEHAEYEEGSVIRQSCRADTYFEYCTWRARNFDCDFEWKRSHDAVKIQGCTPQGFKDRVRFVGNYSSHECGIELRDAEVGDGGEWTCVMEAYVYGLVRGTRRQKTFRVEVVEKTTTTTTSTTTTTTITSTSTTTTTTTSKTTTSRTTTTISITTITNTTTSQFRGTTTTATSVPASTSQENMVITTTNENISEPGGALTSTEADDIHTTTATERTSASESTTRNPATTVESLQTLHTTNLNTEDDLQSSTAASTTPESTTTEGEGPREDSSRSDTIRARIEVEDDVDPSGGANNTVYVIMAAGVVAASVIVLAVGAVVVVCRARRSGSRTTIYRFDCNDGTAQSRPGSERRYRQDRHLMTMSLIDDSAVHSDTGTAANIVRNADSQRIAGIAWGAAACSSFDEEVCH